MSEILTIRVPAAERARWEKAAAAAQETMADFVRKAVRERARASGDSPWDTHLGLVRAAVPPPTNANIRQAFGRRARSRS
jgi:hypothetical protein